MRSLSNKAHILISALSGISSNSEVSDAVLIQLKQLQTEQLDIVSIVRSFGASKIIRQLRLSAKEPTTVATEDLKWHDGKIFLQSHLLGNQTIFYKAPLPGELQARLAIESIIERFLEYLQKIHYIAVLEESDRHVRLFIPGEVEPDFDQLWYTFLEEVAFSIYGNSKYQLPGLLQTFVLMMNAVTLSDRGFSKLDIPVVTSNQSNVLAALYYAVFQAVKQRQDTRQSKINRLEQELKDPNLSDKERTKKQKDIASREAMQTKELTKYTDNFQKIWGKVLNEQTQVWQDLQECEARLLEQDLTTKERKKLQKQKDKLLSKVIFEQSFVEQKLNLLLKVNNNPFGFIEIDQKVNDEKFKPLQEIAKYFSKTATDQISSAKGDIFALCLLEMYQLLENEQYEPLPQPLLTKQPNLAQVRSPGDDSKDFCYSCGLAIDPKKESWKVARFMFERPYQRRQSSANEGQPQICTSCSVLSFASPLKVSDKSIIIRLDPKNKSGNQSLISEQKLKEYIRMLANKDVHLSAGRYVVLNSDRTNSGDFASQKLGAVQFAIAKVASIFPLDVLKDFDFSLFIQAHEPIPLLSRHLIFIKGLMDNYYQFIIVSGKEVNSNLGESIRYVQQDLSYLADYNITKIANASDVYGMEQVREAYWNVMQNELNLKEHSMNPNESFKRAKRYRDVAALTGLTMAFAQSLDSRTKDQNGNNRDETDREVSKLIEQVEDATSFCYYATLGVDNRVEARLWKNRDNYFVYSQTRELLNALGIEEREGTDEEKGSTWLQLYADDISRAYTHFAENGYSQEREWKELTYQLKLSLYTRFPRLVRPIKSTGDK
ncbi:hypothetical protein D0962_36220 [Leptolyngbyaceae cyanobacterium CCMR0082]|uniref:Uncharacterized protein n=1 Tax=Adonisia turfae CCMR0082 TaxID=2304604 RepID=A0A6M0SHY4_9CYAN|nr:hypothetical protein [Adonisia turfae]NEZ68117.1 hypothetical protein [Adonisia turfae CCMR0082]